MRLNFAIYLKYKRLIVEIAMLPLVARNDC